jgi:hypothetical protein
MRELPHSACIGQTCVGVLDVGGEELEEAPAGTFTFIGDDGGQGEYLALVFSEHHDLGGRNRSSGGRWIDEWAGEGRDAHKWATPMISVVYLRCR